ncbi:unnamed protein product [Tuber aestivum]|uniref:Uncharacterized protein n=1 Tax=Tuber aestivum TaxID=59557 RepID=A0A292PR69_9PEZI|nr:unnamed protein product [Tuber aestivum]
MPPSLKRKSNPDAPHTPSKRLRTDGLFTPRVMAPTGASRYIPRAPSYQSSAASPAKRISDEEHVEQGLSSKVRILNNRECLHLLPSRKPLSVPVPVLQRKIKPRSRIRNAIIARLSRRRAILLQKQKLENMMERMDSDNVYYFSEGLSDDIKLFTSRSPASFSGFSVDIPDLEMDVGEPTDCTAEITPESPSQPASDPEPPVKEKVTTGALEGGTVKGGGADEELVQERKPKPEGRGGREKDSMEDAEAEPEGEKDLVKDDEPEEKKDDKKEAPETLSTKDKLVNDRIKERFGEDGMICLNVKTKKAEEEESTAAKKSPIKKKVKVVLPPTLEEDEEEDEKEAELPRKRDLGPSNPRKKGEEADDTSGSEGEDREGKHRRRSSRSRIRKNEGEERGEGEEKERELEAHEKVSQREPKHADTDLSDTEKDDDELKQEKGGEASAQVDKMEEDADAESAGSSGEDTDMSTDDGVPTETVESIEEEDVTMDEDSSDSGDSRNTSDQKKEVEGEKRGNGLYHLTLLSRELNRLTAYAEHEADNEDNRGSSTIIKTDSRSSNEEAKKSKRVKALTLSSQAGEIEVAPTPKTPSSAASLRYSFSISKTPKSPRSPRLFKHDLVPSSPLGFSTFVKKKKTLLKPEIERDAGLWMLGKSSGLHPKRRRQLPFNPANVSRHAYRDSDSDDGEDMYTHHHHGFQSSRWETGEAEDDDVYLHLGWSWDGRGRYNSWMMEHGGPLLEFCVRKLEGFNMAW